MPMEKEDRDAIVNAIQAGFASQGGGNSGGNTQAMGKFNKAFEASTSKLGDIVKGYGKVLDSGGGRIADATGAVSTTLGQLVGYVEDTNSAFQSLSKVGAGLDADLGALRMMAAQTRMPLDQFAGLIAKNSTELAGFAGGVNGGTRRFTQLSNAMFEGGMVDGFMNLGMTLGETNEFLIDQMNIDRRRARLTGMTEAQQVESTLELAQSMDAMAKLTGKSAKEQQDQLKDRMRDGATQAKIRLLEMDGVTGASQSYKMAQASLASAPKVVGDLMADLVQTGVPMTAATKNFAATNKEAYALLQQAANATKQGDTVAAEKYAKDAAAATASFANSRQGLTIATLAQVSEIAQGQADRLEAMAPLIDAMAEHSEKIGNAIGNTGDYIVAFNDMLKGLTENSGNQMAGNNSNQDAQQSIQKGQLALANAASKANESIGGLIRNGEGANKIFKEGVDMLTTATTGLSKGVATLTALLGGPQLQKSEDNSAETNQAIDIVNDPTSSQAEISAALKHLQKVLVLGPNGLKTDDYNTREINKRIEGIKNLRKPTEEGGDPSEATGGAVDSLLRILGLREEGGPVVKDMPYIVGEDGPELMIPDSFGDIIDSKSTSSLLSSDLPDISNDLSNMFKGLLATVKMPDNSNNNVMNNLQKEMKMFSAPMSDENKVLKDLHNEMLAFGAPITDATKSFAANNEKMYSALSSQTQAMQANNVAPNMNSILKRNEPTNNMQESSSPNADSLAKATAGQMQSASSVEEKLDILNQTMLQLVGINNIQTQIGNKQIKTMRSTGNLMQGIGRA